MSSERGCLALEWLQTGRLQRGGVEKYFQVDVGSTGSVKLTAASICLADTNTHTYKEKHMNAWALGDGEEPPGRSHASCFDGVAQKQKRKERREGEPENGRQTKEGHFSTFYSGKISVYDV